MLPPGISFNALSPKAIEASKTSKLPKPSGPGTRCVEMNKTGYFPYTPNTNLLYGLAEACDMLLDPHFGGWKACSRGTSAGPRACAAASRPGAWRSSARKRKASRRC
jgi:alanine-glyoxylate transaminase/serine-glyoxylate transaminase/serine-pyruvate transaminase